MSDTKSTTRGRPLKHGEPTIQVTLRLTADVVRYLESLSASKAETVEAAIRRSKGFRARPTTLAHSD